MKCGVVIFPGSNCDFDTHHVLKNVYGRDTVFLWHKDHSLHNCDLVILPGGFSYGDYLRSGAIARFSPLMQELQEFADRGGMVLGICNGFQVLLELGLLPGAMLRNKNLKFLCRHVHLSLENTATPFTNRGEKGRILHIPIAHFDGNYYTDPATLIQLKQNNRIVFRYCDTDGKITDESNVNGSMENIAGLINKDGNVLGMMPHPERASEAILGSEDGRVVFDSVFHYLKTGSLQ
ncbi:MAG: phosphoribosylformylglycinamidine synthase subunit PurQ [Acidobacteria bacterium]|nr:phosphoribosylformylglycinamidine synthase subunit PurQ [Acidobacteriota bacterium]MCG2815101.1 phosphoribosylformylglycinamidine synthase subunit PurQ [Candidatus Aminicenantes bacterium]MBU1338855.1 phosphoribosylformylglycinamidine synthase subunit PurQ [Acidobacteriota bacterium]MBU1473530.1 phosphoribosylformylglycinamidine synthase subunit PurQ [Acidobacteriota bacterium]MBU2437601.1 phosphoribosylformylglycinamidine synthase subunit PurQ [Acidobacteriota bacterium]